MQLMVSFVVSALALKTYELVNGGILEGVALECVAHECVVLECVVLEGVTF